MPLYLKDLIVVLFISSIGFKFAQPIVLLFTEQKDYSRRRNLWYLLTIVAFLSPNIWIYALIAIPFLIAAGRKDTNPSALYLFLLHVIPQVSATIPLPGGAKLIDLSNPLLLSLCIFVPAIGVLRRSEKGDRIRGLRIMDYCLLAYGVITSVLYIHLVAPDGSFYQSSFSDFLRRIFIFSIGLFIPYFFISRSGHSRRVILDNAAAVLLSCGVMALIAIFETARGWLLYETISERWGLAASFTSYFVRGSSLRGMASTAHSLSLGYDLAIAFGFWFALQTYVKSRVTRQVVTVLLGLGLIATYSRGPWACALLIYVTFALFRPGARSAFFSSVLALTVVLGAIGLSPFGKKIAALIPFLGGTVDQSSIEYRQRLLQRGWEIIRDNPLLGDQYALAKMEDLRQGQGIIDFVNGYIAELLATGLLGLSIFLSVVLSALLKVLRASKAVGSIDRRLSLVGVSLGCGILGTLFLWAFGGPDPDVLWALVAMAVGYSHMSQPHGLMKLRLASPGVDEP